MGLFDRAKNAFGAAGAGAAGAGQAGAGQDWAAQAVAAQQLASQHLKDAGYTNGSMVTMANAGAVNAAAQADHDVLNAYGQELNRVIAIGAAGSAVVKNLVDTGERTAGNPWYVIESEITLPSAAPYLASMRQMIPAMVLGNYAAGSVHEVKVDPADPQNYVLTT